MSLSSDDRADLFALATAIAGAGYPPDVQHLAHGTLALLTPDPGRLMVERVNAGAAAVAAVEGLQRAERELGRGKREDTLYAAAVARFTGAFQALDAAQAALHRIVPHDADPVRHREQVAFILRERLDRLDRLYEGAGSPAALAEEERLEAELSGLGPTVGAVLDARWPPTPPEEDARW